MLVRDVFTSPVVAVRPATTMREAVTVLTENRFAMVPVVDDDGIVIGVLSESDALRAASRDPQVTVATAMTAPAMVAGLDDEVGVVAERMLDERLRSMPVIDGDVLIGIVSRQDLLRTMVRRDDVLAARVRFLLDDYAGHRRHWNVAVDSGAAAIAGSFADDAEQRIIGALALSVPGVHRVDITANELL
ncbi:MAG TPA: CBS domain-containing protein [Aldersonia sp.]